MSDQWKPIETVASLFTRKHIPDAIIVWNDCNGPHVIEVPSDEWQHFRFNQEPWTMWREFPAGPTAQDMAGRPRHYRISISMKAGMLARIDAAAKARRMSRSAFLVASAKAMMEGSKP